MISSLLYIYNSKWNMPFNYSYNQGIKNQIENIAYKKVAHLNQVAENPATIEAPSQQDFLTAVAHPELEWGLW